MFNRAFKEIEDITNNKLIFKEEKRWSDGNIDIKINLIKKSSSNNSAGEAFVQGKTFYPFHESSVAIINLYLYNEGETGGYPLVEMHELLHTLGLNHVKNTLMDEKGIMYRQLTYDKTLIKMLKEEWSLSEVRYKNSLGQWETI